LATLKSPFRLSQKDPWRLTPPGNILNECPFFDFAKQNQKMGIHSLFFSMPQAVKVF
jgi:hypothetical protein